MANTEVFNDTLKNKVKADLLQAIISGLAKKTLTLAGMKASANYILDHIEAIKNYSQLMVFMDELKIRWPIFENVYKLYSNKLYQEKEQEVISRLQGFIKSHK